MHYAIKNLIGMAAKKQLKLSLLYLVLKYIIIQVIKILYLKQSGIGTKTKKIVFNFSASY